MPNLLLHYTCNLKAYVFINTYYSFAYFLYPGFPTGVASMGGAPQNLMGGGLKSKHGGSLKCRRKIPVKEFI